MADPVAKAPDEARTQSPGIPIAGISDEESPAPTGVILEDLPCRTCGYNLRGLSSVPGVGRCPECDTPINRSLSGDLLRFSDPRWVRTIARGLRILEAAVALGFVSLAAAWVLLRLLNFRRIMFAGVLPAGLLAIAGVWLGTQRDPAAIEVEPMFSTRRLLRAVVLLSVVLEAIGVAIPLPGRRTALILDATIAAVWVAAILLSFRYAMSLARRIPNDTLRSETRGIMWGMIVSYTLVLALIAMALSSTPVSPILGMVFGLSCTVIVGCVVFTLWTLALIARYASALRQAAIDAEATWAQPAGNAAM